MATGPLKPTFRHSGKQSQLRALTLAHKPAGLLVLLFLTEHLALWEPTSLHNSSAEGYLDR